MQVAFYNPNQIEKNTVEELLRQELFRLEPVQADLPGIYLLYYTGDCPLYAAVRGPNVPIYIGYSKQLGSRLTVHCNTLDEVFAYCTETGSQHLLDRNDFLCRCLQMPDGDALKYEKILIEKYQPWWNVEPKFMGFGCDGSPRKSGKASFWDQLHPGRGRALKYIRPPTSVIQSTAQATVESAVRRDDPGIFDLFPVLALS